jgi:hypothetical protein
MLTIEPHSLIDLRTVTTILGAQGHHGFMDIGRNCQVTVQGFLSGQPSNRPIGDVWRAALCTSQDVSCNLCLLVRQAAVETFC